MDTNEPVVRHWTRTRRPTPQDIENRMREEHLPYYRWSNGPGDVYAAHRHTYHKVIYVVKGSITFGLPEMSGKINLSVGDRLDLPAGIAHDAVVGPEGVECLEGHRETA